MPENWNLPRPMLRTGPSSVWTSMRILPACCARRGSTWPPSRRLRGRAYATAFLRAKTGIGEPETFVMPGIPSISPVPSTLVPCTQNRDFLIYDWPARHEAVCRLVRETHPDLLFIGDSITHFWGGNPVDEPHRDILQKSPETWAACTEGMRAANLGFRLRPRGKRPVEATPRRAGRRRRRRRVRGADRHE